MDPKARLARRCTSTTRPWRRLAAALAVAAAAVPVVVSTALPSAAADGPSVSAAPTTGLDPAGDSVTVTGSGYPAGVGLYVRLCTPPSGSPTPTNCSAPSTVWATPTVTEPGTSQQGRTEPVAGGAFSFELPVAGTVGSTDCTVAAGTCGIFVQRDHTGFSDRTFDQFIPLTFVIEEAPTTRITVDPTSGLDAAGDTVGVDGDGFADGVGVYVRLCSAPVGTVGTTAGRPAHCDGQGTWVNPHTVDENTAPMVDGGFSIDLPVAGAFATTEVIDCMEPGSCGIFVRRDHSGASDASYDEFVPLTFDTTTTPPEVEPEPPSLNEVVLTVSKTEGVADGEVVTASGSKYTPEQGVYLQWCEKPAGQLGTQAGRAQRCYPGQDGIHTVWLTPVPASGSFSVSIKAEKGFTTEAGDDVDCSAPGACGVFSRRDHGGGLADFSQDAFVPVTFGDGTAAPVGDASLSADRTTDLDPDGDTITVSGEGFRPGISYFVALCAADDDTACDYANAEEVAASTAAADADVAAVGARAEGAGRRAVAAGGDFRVDLPVVGTFAATDCTVSACAVRTWAVSLSEAADEVSLPVTFAAADGIDAGGVPADAGSGGGAGVLARTGADPRQPLFVGLALLVLGAVVVTGTRRRRAA